MRDARLDTARFALIALVVLGHAIETFQGTPFLALAYRTIYLFHMPAFVFLSGLVARDVLDARQGEKVVATLILPLLLFQAVYLGLEFWLTGKENFRYVLDPPYWTLWYLLSLVCWRLVLPLLLGTGAPLLVSVAISLSAGFFNEVGYGWSLSRTAVFLPFFVAGHLYAQRKGLIVPGSADARRIGLAIVAMIGLGVVAWLTRNMPAQWLYGSTGYASFADGDTTKGFLYRSLYLVSGAAGTWAFLSLVPAGNRFITRCGQCSIAVYLLHGLVIKSLIFTGGFDVLRAQDGWIEFPVLVIGSLLLAVLLAISHPAFKYAMDFGWLLRALRRFLPGQATTPRPGSHLASDPR